MIPLLDLRLRDLRPSKDVDAFGETEEKILDM